MFGTGYTGGDPMKAQTPAEGISLDKDFGGAKLYNIECDCSHDSHAVKMWIEVTGDEDIKDVELTFYVNTSIPWWKGWRYRISTAINVLFNGKTEQQHTLILSRQAGLNIAESIKAVIEDMERKL